MKKLLFITPVYPNENGAGREKRAHQWILKLSKYYEVSMLVVGDQVERKHEKVKAVKELNMLQLNYQHSKVKMVLEIFLHLFSMMLGKSKGSMYLGWSPLHREHKAKLESLYLGKSFDQILCFRLYLRDFAVCVKKLAQVRSMELDMDDIESITLFKIGKLLLRRRHFKKAVLQLLSSAHFYVQEKRLVPFDSVYVCSVEDQSVLRKRFTKLDVKVMPNRLYGTPEPLPMPDDRYQLLFVGSLNYYPNEEAIRWFVNHVFGQLRKKSQRWTLHVAGIGGSAALSQFLSDKEGVIFHGYVDALTELYHQSYLVISPLHAGGGTKLKVMEAMWYGRPLICTYESVHGLGLEPSNHYCGAETAEDFVKGCTRLAQDSDYAKKLVEVAHLVLKDRYTYL